MTKYEKFRKLLDEMYDLHVSKDKDYGSSFSETFKEEGFAAARIKLSDKLNRFKRLSKGNEQHVKDESMRDTLIDMACYSLMTIIEMEEMVDVNTDILDGESLKAALEKAIVTADCENPVREHVNCTMTNCYYNDDHCNCMCSDRHVDPNLLEGCPLFAED